METKTCPSCAADVPVEAARCKECFHAFEEAKSGRSSGPLVLLASLAAMAVVAALVLLYIVSRPTDQHILVDEGTHSIIWTTQYITGPTTERLRFDEVGKIEYVTYQNGSVRVFAVTLDGERKTLNEGTTPSKAEADKYAKLMEKPLEVIDQRHGFETEKAD